MYIVRKTILLKSCDMFSEDQLSIEESEDEFPCSVYELNKIREEHNVKTSVNTSKITAFKREKPITSKVTIDNDILY